MPDGLLVFFPSYYLMDQCIDCWKNMGHASSTNFSTIWERICKNKQPVVEPKQSALFPDAIQDFEAKLHDNISSGAVFFAICRGKTMAESWSVPLLDAFNACAEVQVYEVTAYWFDRPSKFVPMHCDTVSSVLAALKCYLTVFALINTLRRNCLSLVGTSVVKICRLGGSGRDPPAFISP